MRPREEFFKGGSEHDSPNPGSHTNLQKKSSCLVALGMSYESFFVTFLMRSGIRGNSFLEPGFCIPDCQRSRIVLVRKYKSTVFTRELVTDVIQDRYYS